MAVSTAFIATAYGPPWDAMNGSGVTATGMKLPAGPTSQVIPVVAVDPSVIPLGTKLKINPNPFNNPNLIFTAADTGGAIKGARIDFLDMAGRASQDAWGRRPVTVSVVGSGSTTAIPTVSPATSGGLSSGSSTAPGSSSGPSEWVKLLLDAAMLGFGAALVYRGGKHMIAKPS